MSTPLSQRILALLRHPRYQPLDRNELAKRLKLGSQEREELRTVLQTMEENGEIARIRKNRYVLPEEAELVIGTIQIHANGNAH